MASFIRRVSPARCVAKPLCCCTAGCVAARQPTTAAGNRRPTIKLHREGLDMSKRAKEAEQEQADVDGEEPIFFDQTGDVDDREVRP